jgi:hypothetical protein
MLLPRRSILPDTVPSIVTRRTTPWTIRTRRCAPFGIRQSSRPARSCFRDHCFRKRAELPDKNQCFACASRAMLLSCCGTLKVASANFPPMPVMGKDATMQDTPKQEDWTKPAAMAIPKGGFFKDKVEQGRYGPIFPKTPACYGFSIIAKIIPGREPVFYEYAKNIEKAVAEQPDILAVLKLHYLRWNLFDIKGETYFQYMGIFDTDFDKYTDDAVNIFAASGLNTVFERDYGQWERSIALAHQSDARS